MATAEQIFPIADAYRALGIPETAVTPVVMADINSKISASILWLETQRNCYLLNRSIKLNATIRPGDDRVFIRGQESLFDVSQDMYEPDCQDLIGFVTPSSITITSTSQEPRVVTKMRDDGIPLYELTAMIPSDNAGEEVLSCTAGIPVNEIPRIIGAPQKEAMQLYISYLSTPGLTDNTGFHPDLRTAKQLATQGV